MTAARAAAAAAVLRAARAGGRRPGDFAPDCQPRTVEEAYAVQAAVAPSLGPIGGWKVGRHDAAATPLCSPIPAASLLDSGAVIPGPSRYRGLEGEIVFRIGRDLPLRAGPISRGRVEAAVVSCHLAVEVIECRFEQMDAADPLSVVADLQNHEALVVGAPGPDWRGVGFASLPMRLQIEGAEAAQAAGRADDLILLLEWLANVGSAWAGGLKAGDAVTTGSWFAKVSAPPRAGAVLSAPGFEAVEVRFAT